ncbi:MAG: cation-translocating P-type ATPase [Firmicutes bacterium]|nr:cation-translocating P-type ATPase [Bacillota bacterium]
MQTWHCKSQSKTAQELKTDLKHGLSAQQAVLRQRQYGPNELKQEKQIPIWRKLQAQFQDFLTLTLLAAAAISFLVGERTDALLIFLIVLLNAVLGLVQEGRAEKALTALMEMAAPQTTVIRAGNPVVIPARDLVPGDLVLLETGTVIPCDLRLSATTNLKIDEAALTGESLPVEKDANLALAAMVPLADRINMAYAGTTVVYGRGQGLAVATGMETEIGRIAGLLSDVGAEKTPLQDRLDSLGKTLGTIALIICSFIFLTGVIRAKQAGTVLLDMFLVAVSLAVAAIPEGLPAVVTIVLALGTQRMAGKNAIVKKLQAVETLGSTTVICTDKTGTLTQNKMSTVALWSGGESYQLSGPAHRRLISHPDRPVEPDRDLNLILKTVVLCNDAIVENNASGFNFIGDPTECALLGLATAGDSGTISDLRSQFPRLAEVPFDSRRKIMTTLHQEEDGSYLVLTKGAPDVILNLSNQLLLDNHEHDLSPDLIKLIEQQNNIMAEQALRVLALAYRRLPAQQKLPDPKTLEQNLVFLGLVGLKDPLRPETKPAVQKCRLAGIRTIMITGDHPATARAIGQELQLTDGNSFLTGTELDQLSPAEFEEKISSVNVFARVTPQHKSSIVETLQKLGHVVAVTGDGVNDAPALKRADIGIAMGITGTDVAKGAADMILTNDNFASIVEAVNEGRIIYANIRKFVYFLLSCNVGEVLIILLALLGRLPFPLLPVHLLWLNLLTDALPALALGLEQAEPGVMDRAPRPPQEPLLDQKMLTGIVFQSIILAVSVLAVFVIALDNFGLSNARTMAFTTLVLAELLRSFTSRSENYTIFQLGLLSNSALLGGVLLSAGLFLLTLYIPALRAIFHTTPITAAMWRLILPAAILPAAGAELRKVLFGYKSR